MSQFDSKAYIDAHGIISDQVETNELRVVLDEFVKSLAGGGAVVEFGCYIGTTSLFLKRILDKHHDTREFHVYDSFEGLPEKRSVDQSPLGVQFVEGELRATKKQFLRAFKKAGIRSPIIHKGWFHELSEKEIPDTIRFAFLDGDYYESIKTPLDLITPKLAKGAIIIIDDYANQALPGAAKAVDEWCKQHNKQISVVHSLAVVYT